MKRFLIPALAGAVLMATPTAWAQQSPIPPWPPQAESPGGSPGALASAALEQLIRALPPSDLTFARDPALTGNALDELSVPLYAPSQSL